MTNCDYNQPVNLNVAKSIHIPSSGFSIQILVGYEAFFRDPCNLLQIFYGISKDQQRKAEHKLARLAEQHLFFGCVGSFLLSMLGADQVDATLQVPIGIEVFVHYVTKQKLNGSSFSATQLKF